MTFLTLCSRQVCLTFLEQCHTDFPKRPKFRISKSDFLISQLKWFYRYFCHKMCQMGFLHLRLLIYEIFVFFLVCSYPQSPSNSQIWTSNVGCNSIKHQKCDFFYFYQCQHSVQHWLLSLCHYSVSCVVLIKFIETKWHYFIE